MKKLLSVTAAVLALLILLCACAVNDTEEAPEPVETSAPETEAPEPVVEPPIVILDYPNIEEMPEPVEGGGVPDEFTSDEFAVSVGDESFNLQWLYEHSIYDWRYAGIAFDQIEEKSDAILEINMTADAVAAMKQKISDFTMLMMLDPGADLSSTPIITVGDKEFDVEWLSSHNATDYAAENIDAETVRSYLDAMSGSLWYTREYHWISTVYDRLVNGWE